MHPKIPSPRALCLLALLAAPVSGSALAQPEAPATVSDAYIIVNGEAQPDTSAMTPGPELKGVITARRGDRMKVTAPDGTSSTLFITSATQVRSGGGFLGGNRALDQSALLNGLPVTVKTMHAGDQLVASQVRFRGGDFKTASMIHAATNQGFAEQTAASSALRGRMGDIDNYNVKGSTSVNFDTGKAVLSEQAKADLCNAATQAEGMSNALLLVVGYTDSTGSPEFNQVLSERRAASVINFLQQSCHWKPYRMLTPTGMSQADPVASNDTPEGKAQNRRVAVNILVSKAVDGL